MAKSKFYVVWNGKKPGVYNNWEECKKQIKGFSGAIYKSFEREEEAKKAFIEGFNAYFDSKNKNLEQKKECNIPTYIKKSISTDAACRGNPGPVEYRIVETATGNELYRSPVYNYGTINIGEFLAIVHALAMLKKRGQNIPIYSDSKTAIKWVMNKEIKTKLEKTEFNKPIFELIERALKWLNENEWTNPLLKWETGLWGEIPADFGRK
ncbi:MAG TPA: ribonuclease H family protein [Bacteroidales bacterium]|nr:ribonuclease H family protein [Bacteroidales bacterium]